MTEQNTTEKETPAVEERRTEVIDRILNSGSFTIRDFLSEEDSSYLSINYDSSSDFCNSVSITLHDGRGTAQLYYDIAEDEEISWGVSSGDLLVKIDSVIGALAALKIAINRDAELAKNANEEEGGSNED